MSNPTNDPSILAENHAEVALKHGESIIGMGKTLQEHEGGKESGEFIEQCGKNVVEKAKASRQYAQTARQQQGQSRHESFGQAAQEHSSAVEEHIQASKEMEKMIQNHLEHSKKIAGEARDFLGEQSIDSP